MTRKKRSMTRRMTLKRKATVKRLVPSFAGPQRYRRMLSLTLSLVRMERRGKGRRRERSGARWERRWRKSLGFRRERRVNKKRERKGRRKLQGSTTCILKAYFII
uniref:Uncharacterized protein n=1 Tax=Cacopsylla melanoneura TaxID=428564 RepID=A0A8D8S021_9HEMI